jgi:hypothetical protein
MSWNYRIYKSEQILGGKSYDIFQVIEVFYNDDNGRIKGWSDVSQSVLIWDNYEDLKGTAEMVQHAFNKPTLTLVDDELVELNEK